jgi:hypothetical protein
MRIGNVAGVVKTMTHRDLKTAMLYQHPELDVVRTVLDYGAASKIVEMRVQLKKVYDTSYDRREAPQLRHVIDHRLG